MAQTVGAKLTVDRSPEARELSLALSKYLNKLDFMARQAGSTVATTVKDGDPECRVFLSEYAGDSNDSTKSPGGDCCFVVDTEHYDLYFISGWATSTSYTATCVRNTVA